jgi:predicted amidohydrolase
MDNELRISLVQTNIVWENKPQNLEFCSEALRALSGKSDLAVFPEMFSTGFSMKAARLAETNDGETISLLKSLASENGVALCGSFLAKDDGERIFNRGFFIRPDGKTDFYDKRHLFRMGEENTNFEAGEKPLIVSYRGWNIRLIICYDLRFPVWCRNRGNEYDLLVCPANWPAARTNVWQTLLRARALENQCYVCGVNRVGSDGIGIPHQGDSVLLDYKANPLIETEINKVSIKTATANLEQLADFRRKFPAYLDADKFEIF